MIPPAALQPKKTRIVDGKAATASVRPTNKLMCHWVSSVPHAVESEALLNLLHVFS